MNLKLVFDLHYISKQVNSCWQNYILFHSAISVGHQILVISKGLKPPNLTMDGSTEKESQETKVREAVEKAMKTGGSDPNVPHPVLVCAELEILPIAFRCYSLIDLL